MNTRESFSESMSDWVGTKKASEITGLNHSNVSRNATNGRLIFRVREGHVYYYKPQLEEWKAPPFGNPMLIKDANYVWISKEAKLKISDVRKTLKETGSDAVCWVAVKSKRFVLNVAQVKVGSFGKPNVINLDS